MAFKILTTPASSASVERVFFYDGDVTKGKRNRLSDYNLVKEKFCFERTKSTFDWCLPTVKN